MRSNMITQMLQNDEVHIKNDNVTKIQNQYSQFHKFPINNISAFIHVKSLCRYTRFTHFPLEQKRIIERDLYFSKIRSKNSQNLILSLVLIFEIYIYNKHMFYAPISQTLQVRNHPCLRVALTP